MPKYKKFSRVKKKIKLINPQPPFIKGEYKYIKIGEGSSFSSFGVLGVFVFKTPVANSNKFFKTACGNLGGSGRVYSFSRQICIVSLRGT